MLAGTSAFPLMSGDITSSHNAHTQCHMRARARVRLTLTLRGLTARLSWTVCALLGGGGPLQTVLQAKGTRDRLEIVLGWLLALRKNAGK